MNEYVVIYEQPKTAAGAPTSPTGLLLPEPHHAFGDGRRLKSDADALMQTIEAVQPDLAMRRCPAEGKLTDRPLGKPRRQQVNVTQASGVIARDRES